jgi:hypothetical protein
MAAGNDAVQFAFLTTQTAPLTFEGMVTVQGGSGVDSLLLGNSSGDTYSIVNFTATSKFIGGPGIDTFDPTAAEVTGTATVTW